VSEEFDHQVLQGEQSVLRHRRSKVSGILASISLLAVIAGACAYLWINFGVLFQSGRIFLERPAATAVVANAEKTVSVMDFKAFQQQTTDSLQAAAQDIAIQKADQKNQSVQVSALSAKIEALQSTAQSTGSVSGEPRPAPQQSAVATRPAVVAARKKPPAPKTTGPISVGGAPLPSATPDDQ
jgi:hypothetical protein